MPDKITDEEALRILERVNLTGKGLKWNFVFMHAQRALLKQIPKKVLPENEYFGVGRCPHCGAVFLDSTTKYCGECGQRLDWGSDGK